MKARFLAMRIKLGYLTIGQVPEGMRDPVSAYL